MAYQERSFESNQGLRIDYLLLAPQAIDRLESCAIDAEQRAVKAPAGDGSPGVWCLALALGLDRY